MSNSIFVTYTALSPNYTKRTSKINKITLHHMAGNLSVEKCGEIFAPTSRQASSNYGIGSDGRVALYVDESNRAWTSGNFDNDNQAVTIEVANDEIGGNWHVSDNALSAVIDVCVDICKRNGIPTLNFTGNASGNLTMHSYFQATACPGAYLKSRFAYIAEEVNKRININANVQPETPKPATKNIEQLANEVIKGAWGNGSDRKSNLESAGYDYNAIQERVNALLGGNTPPAPKPVGKSIDQLANEVIRGDWGNGSDRKNNLEVAGHDYNAIQARVNQLLG